MKIAKVILSYDGTNFNGWQDINGERTVQKVVEDTLEMLLKRKVRTVASGRTDRGVHAKGQVISFLMKDSENINGLSYRMNTILPEDVIAISSNEESLDFHARFSSKAKKYQYIIANREIFPYERNYMVSCTYKLDYELIRQSLNLFIGKHDFYNFHKPKNAFSKNTYREIYSFEIYKLDNNILKFEVIGSGFLQHQVRMMIGAIISVGRGKYSLDDLQKAIDRKKFTPGYLGPAFPSHALILEEVYY